MLERFRIPLISKDRRADLTRVLMPVSSKQTTCDDAMSRMMNPLGREPDLGLRAYASAFEPNRPSFDGKEYTLAESHREDDGRGETLIVGSAATACEGNQNSRS